MRRLLFSVAVSLFVLGACDAGDEIAEIETENVAVTDEAEEVIEEPAPEIDDADVEIVISSLEEGFSDFNDISFISNRGTFLLTPKDGASETNTLINIANNPNEENHEQTLIEMSSSLIEFSEIIRDNIAEGLSIELDNPTQDETPLFIITDGNVEYPILE